jgi:hypothetical protein
MIYPTKTALVLRRDLLPWQIANVAAFLTGGLAGTYPEMVGEPYRDGSDRFYTPLVREPVFVYGGDAADLARVHQRALSRTPRIAIYTAPLFRPTMMRTTAPTRASHRSARLVGSASMRTARSWTR